MCACVGVWMCVCMCVCARVGVWMCVCMGVCMCVCMGVCRECGRCTLSVGLV